MKISYEQYIANFTSFLTNSNVIFSISVVLQTDLLRMSLSKAAIPLNLKDEKFHPSRCVICYSKSNTKGLQGGDIGRKRVREIAEQEKDEVYKRLKMMPADWKFKYHNNACYKSYGDKRKLQGVVAPR